MAGRGGGSLALGVGGCSKKRRRWCNLCSHSRRIRGGGSTHLAFPTKKEKKGLKKGGKGWRVKNSKTNEAACRARIFLLFFGWNIIYVQTFLTPCCTHFPTMRFTLLQCLNLNKKCPPPSNFPDSAFPFLILRESEVGDVFFPYKEMQNLKKTSKKGETVVGGKLSFVFHLFPLFWSSCQSRV